MEFTSGITYDNIFLISMNHYREEDILITFKLSKRYHGLNQNSYIDLDDYMERFMTFEWKGNIFYPTDYENEVEGSQLIRMFEIKKGD